MRNTDVNIRFETPHDIPAIREVTEAAFEKAEHSSGTEAAIVDGLRAAEALTVNPWLPKPPARWSDMSRSLRLRSMGRAAIGTGWGPSPFDLTGKAMASDRN